MTSIDNTSSFEVFDRMSEKVDRLEAENEAAIELSETEEGKDDLEKKFAELESDTTSPEFLLEDLKQRMKEEGESNG